MQLAYLDESKAPTAYYVTALVVSDKDTVALSRGLDEVVEWAQDNHGGVRDNAELHAVDLAGGQRDWAKYRPPEKIPARVAVYERAVDVIASFDVRAYIRGADDKVFAKRYSHTDVHGVVLSWVLERVQNDAVGHDDLALVIADELQHRDRYRRHVRDYQRYGTAGWKPEVLDRIADTLHFAPSHSSRLLQAADLVSYAHLQTCRTQRDSRAKEAWRRIWAKLDGVVQEATCWCG